MNMKDLNKIQKKNPDLDVLFINSSENNYVGGKLEIQKISLDYVVDSDDLQTPVIDDDNIDSYTDFLIDQCGWKKNEAQTHVNENKKLMIVVVMGTV